MLPSRLSDFDYRLPPELIAQEPLARRDRSRMLVIDRQQQNIAHRDFLLLPDYLREGDLLLFNNTRVIPARLEGVIAGKNTAVELLLLHSRDDGRWESMVRPGRKLKPGIRVDLAPGVQAVIEDYSGEGLRLISFESPEPVEKILNRLGKVPLPPYIHREVREPGAYQTVYATEDGSAAAPTAGFHFTAEIFETLRQKGIETAFTTLHIGPGTFQPVKTEDISRHTMHSEYYRLDTTAAGQLNRVKQEGGRIVAVGTTVCRILETMIGADGLFAPGEGWTDLFIFPGFEFRAVDALLTNFHLPRSTLLMLVSALAGYTITMSAYREAVERRYRFFSFGDCMLVL